MILHFRYARVYVIEVRILRALPQWFVRLSHTARNVTLARYPVIFYGISVVDEGIRTSESGKLLISEINSNVSLVIPANLSGSRSLA